MSKPIKFPSIARVVTELCRINTTVIDVCADHGADCEDDCAAYIDVRLQVYPDGAWAVHSGLADYDTDHRGFWGASSVPGNGCGFNARDTARDLISQARNSHAEQAPPTGYVHCACRDCFETTIGVSGVTFCDDCIDAECSLDHECQRSDAYTAE